MNAVAAGATDTVLPFEAIETNILICPVVPPASVITLLALEPSSKVIAVVSDAAPLGLGVSTLLSPKNVGTLLNTFALVIFLFVYLVLFFLRYFKPKNIDF